MPRVRSNQPNQTLTAFAMEKFGEQPLRYSEASNVCWENARRLTERASLRLRTLGIAK